MGDRPAVMLQGTTSLLMIAILALACHRYSLSHHWLLASTERDAQRGNAYSCRSADTTTGDRADRSASAHNSVDCNDIPVLAIAENGILRTRSSVAHPCDLLSNLYECIAGLMQSQAVGGRPEHSFILSGEGSA